MRQRGMIVLKANGEEEFMALRKPPTLPQLQEAVGGYIEYVKLPPGNGQAKMVVNEEGALIGLGVNAKASDIARQLIVGDAALYYVNAPEGEDDGKPQDE